MGVLSLPISKVNVVVVRRISSAISSPHSSIIAVRIAGLFPYGSSSREIYSFTPRSPFESVESTTTTNVPSSYVSRTEIILCIFIPSSAKVQSPEFRLQFRRTSILLREYHLRLVPHTHNYSPCTTLEQLQRSD